MNRTVLKKSLPVQNTPHSANIAEKNLWRNRFVATAFSYQQKARPYLELVETTESLINPLPGQSWLDLGCGSGRLVRCIWERSQASVEQIYGLDLSYTALKYAKKSISRLTPAPPEGRIQFVQANFSSGLDKLFRPESFDGVTAGLSIQYAENWDAALQRWDNRSYLRLLRDIYVILKENGSFVFSSNVPNPNFLAIAMKSWREIVLTWKLPLAISVSSIMLYQARWLKACAQKGRFHYLPAHEIIGHLRSVGFRAVKHELTYANQAWVFVAVK